MLNRIIRRITNNFGLKILAVIFASVLWLVVVNIDDPNTTRTFSASVFIENSDYLSGLGKYYEVINNSNTVTFKVSGKRSYLERMSNADFRAVADLETIENLERVPIEIMVQRYSGSVTVINKTYYLELEVEDLISKPFMITVQTDGEVAERHALGETSASPTLLRVSGPASVVNTIDKAVATVDVEGMSQDVTDSVIPVLYDKEGNEVDTKELSYNIQNVMVSMQILDTKDVTLNFQTTGTLPDGYEYVGIEYKPQTVSVKGTAAVLNTVNSITVPREVLNLTDATGDIEKDVDISSYLPEGVSLVNSKDAKISVVVKVEKHERRKFEMPTANITVSNLPGRYDVKFSQETVKVEIEGLALELDVLDEKELTGSIDVSGMTEGEHTVNLDLNLDSKFKLVKNVTVTVEIVSAGSSSSSESDKNTSDDDANNDDSQKTDTKKPEE
ncbi:MAG: hypothetical protein HFI82_01905 [Eubacterium sp.]|jgi:YbbR domain-containing protein|nr:hypothetical protein [Eubacterium sp.]